MSSIGKDEQRQATEADEDDAEDDDGDDASAFYKTSLGCCGAEFGKFEMRIHILNVCLI